MCMGHCRVILLNAKCTMSSSLWMHCALCEENAYHKNNNRLNRTFLSLFFLIFSFLGFPHVMQSAPCCVLTSCPLRLEPDMRSWNQLTEQSTYRGKSNFWKNAIPYKYCYTNTASSAASCDCFLRLWVQQIGDNLFSIEPVELSFIVLPSFTYAEKQVVSSQQLFSVSVIALLFFAFLAELG